MFTYLHGLAFKELCSKLPFSPLKSLPYFPKDFLMCFYCSQSTISHLEAAVRYSSRTWRMYSFLLQLTLEKFKAAIWKQRVQGHLGNFNCIAYKIQYSMYYKIQYILIQNSSQSLQKVLVYLKEICCFSDVSFEKMKAKPPILCVDKASRRRALLGAVGLELELFSKAIGQSVLRP